MFGRFSYLLPAGAACLVLALAGCSGEPAEKSAAPASTAPSSPAVEAPPAQSVSSQPQSNKSILESGIDQGQLTTIYDRRNENNQKYWSDEVRAQHYEQTVVKYWDQMLQPEDDKFAVFASWPFESIQLGDPGEPSEVEWGILHRIIAGNDTTLSHDDWVQFVKDKEAAGYRIEDVEFHQAEYVPGDGVPDQSVFSVLLHVVNADRSTRWLLKGKVAFDWSTEVDADGLNLVQSAKLLSFDAWERTGARYFTDVMKLEELEGLGPVLSYDLNGDGLPEVLSPQQDIVLRNQGGGVLNRESLFGALGVQAPVAVRSAVIADFTDDGFPDLLCTARHPETPHRRVVVLCAGDAQGRFVTAPMVIHDLSLAISEPCAMTAGDIDGDNDLDVWLAQYKQPYIHGQMPTPFYDANDGFPSYLFVNQGNGRFVDGTNEAGLAPKRFRRTYSASFADLDEDNDLDLLVVSDFYGIDLHLNDGTGKFTDVTEDALDEWHNFGMGHTFADFNSDGALDFYVSGMGSTTMRRLNDLGLARDDRPEIVEKRTVMGYGNRMYLKAGEGPTFVQPDFRDSVSRTGWSWGVVALDFDNDADQDIYVVNGHASGKSTKDYCSTYWCHDVYEGESQADLTLGKYFTETLSNNLSKTMSWDGYQKNHLLMNQQGDDFLNVAFVMDVAFGYDARSAIGDDIDGDGRPDLIVTSVKRVFAEDGTPSQTTAIHIVRNGFPSDNNWIGVRLYEAKDAPSPVGAKIRVRSGESTQVGMIATGDSWRAQHTPAKHFGLGKAEAVASLEVQWPNGHLQIIENPAVNAYHRIDYDGPPPGQQLAAAQ
jgi:hypothetical protein